MRISRERLMASAERVNRQFAKHRMLWILRAAAIAAAVIDLLGLALLILAAVFGDHTAAVLLLGLGIWTLTVAVQVLVLVGVLVLWWVNNVRDREIATIQTDLGAVRDEVDRVAVMTRSQQLRQLADELSSTASKPAESHPAGRA